MLETHLTRKSASWVKIGGAALGAVLLAGMIGLGTLSRAAEEPRIIPAYAGSEQPAKTEATSEIAVLAGGCFWGVQGVFQHVNGVSKAISGYAGGAKETASYQMTGSGTTGHAEAVHITFDPRQISYAKLLQIYFSVAHDPTQLNRQGPDTGTQYRSTIFPTTPEQEKIAKTYISQLDQAKVFPRAIATTVENNKPFYWAEAYHQDFLTKHPSHPYIVFNDLPKVADLKRIFSDVYRAEPALVGDAKSPS